MAETGSRVRNWIAEARAVSRASAPVKVATSARAPARRSRLTNRLARSSGERSARAPQGQVLTGAGSSDVGGTAQTQGAEILLIFSAIPIWLFGVDGAIAIFLGLGAIALVVAGVLWVQLRVEKKK